MCHRQQREEPPAPWDTPWESPCPTTPILHHHGLIWEPRKQLSPSVHTDLRLHKPLCRGDGDCPTLCTRSAGFLSPHIPLPTGHKQSLSGATKNCTFHKKMIKGASPAVLTCGALLRNSRRARKCSHF